MRCWPCTRKIQRKRLSKLLIPTKKIGKRLKISITRSVRGLRMINDKGEGMAFTKRPDQSCSMILAATDAREQSVLHFYAVTIHPPQHDFLTESTSNQYPHHGLPRRRTGNQLLCEYRRYRNCQIRQLCIEHLRQRRQRSFPENAECNCDKKEEVNKETVISPVTFM